MVIVIDNYDSFTYNLVHYIAELGEEVSVYRNDSITVEQIEELNPRFIVISPGPCTPREAGISVEVVSHFTGRIPILGVCLGHQSIAYAFGGKIIQAERLLHGKTSPIFHDKKGIFSGVPSPFEATRYHSLLVDRDTLDERFEVSAWTEEGEIMGIRHKDCLLEGIQFHPESVLTVYGKQILVNFVNLVNRYSY